MTKPNSIAPIDKRLFPIVVSPTFLTFLFLALAPSESAWFYWLMSLGGWYLSALIWWHLYQHYVINRAPPNRGKFYTNCILTQLTVSACILLYIFYR